MAVRNGKTSALPRLLRAASLLALSGLGLASEAGSGRKRHACFFFTGWKGTPVTEYVVTSAAGTAAPPSVMSGVGNFDTATFCHRPSVGEKIKIAIKDAGGNEVASSQEVGIVGGEGATVTKLQLSDNRQAVLVEDLVHHGEFWNDVRQRVSKMIEDGQTLADGEAWMKGLLQEVKTKHNGWHINIFMDHMTAPVIFKVGGRTATRKPDTSVLSGTQKARHTGWSFPVDGPKTTLTVATGTESKDITIEQVGYAGAVQFKDGANVHVVVADAYEGHEAVWTATDKFSVEGGEKGPWKHWSDEDSQWRVEGLRSIAMSIPSSGVSLTTYAMIGAAAVLVIGVVMYCFCGGGGQSGADLPSSQLSAEFRAVPSMYPDEYEVEEVVRQPA